MIPPYTLYPYGLEFLHRSPIKRGLMQIMMHYFINHENTRSILLVTVFKIPFHKGVRKFFNWNQALSQSIIITCTITQKATLSLNLFHVFDSNKNIRYFFFIYLTYSPSFVKRQSVDYECPKRNFCILLNMEVLLLSHKMYSSGGAESINFVITK